MDGQDCTSYWYLLFYSVWSSTARNIIAESRKSCEIQEIARNNNIKDTSILIYPEYISNTPFPAKEAQFFDKDAYIDIPTQQFQKLHIIPLRKHSY